MTSGRARTILLAFALVLAGCGSASASASPSPIAAPTPTPVPGAGGVDGGSGSGSGSGGNTGGGVVNPPCCKVVDPILGQATMVVAQPGQRDVHAVNIQLLRSSVDGHHVTVELRWWSGVAPCSVLDSVGIGHVDTTYTIEAGEGSSGQPVACIDIAQLKATIVDLGDFDPGTYTIKAVGEAKPIEVTVT